jgi:hypothetical protein
MLNTLLFDLNSRSSRDAMTVIPEDSEAEQEAIKYLGLVPLVVGFKNLGDWIMADRGCSPADGLDDRPSSLSPV